MKIRLFPNEIPRRLSKFFKPVDPYPESGQFIARNVNIWHKPNSMPSSVTDRFSNSYEPVFMFSKTNKAQFYVNQKTLLMQHKKGDGPNWRSVNYFFDVDAVRKRPATGLDRASRYDCNTKSGSGSQEGRKKECEKRGFVELSNNPAGENPGDIWSIPTQPRPEAHFAAFPDKLAAKVITVGCPKEVCPQCGLPRVRVRRPTAGYAKHLGTAWCDHTRDDTHGCIKDDTKGHRMNSEYITIGFSSCSCNVPYVPGVILDPFMGAGTVAVVAKQLLRDYIGAELNPEYITITENRLAAAQIGQRCLVERPPDKQLTLLPQ
ncbi:MAG: site-specific DNA-methyltransferase [Deltaproteobacteria bacterium]|nr:site-specific DNA-methyltransferase [Deltaproteobacteria bacterium]